jgi:hypothetical protein
MVFIIKKQQISQSLRQKPEFPYKHWGDTKAIQFHFFTKTEFFAD